MGAEIAVMGSVLIKYVRDYVKSNSECELIGKYYRGYNGKFKFKCKCGNIFESTFNSFKKKKVKQCNSCSGKARYTINDIREYVKNNSECELVSNEYINSYTKMKFKCKCGNVFETKFNSFKYCNKRQCNKCGMSKTDTPKQKIYKNVCRK